METTEQIFTAVRLMFMIHLYCIISLNLTKVGELAGAGGFWRWVFVAIFGSTVTGIIFSVYVDIF